MVYLGRERELWTELKGADTMATTTKATAKARTQATRTVSAREAEATMQYQLWALWLEGQK